jgi:multiple sugar transport system permease protein
LLQESLPPENIQKDLFQEIQKILKAPAPEISSRSPAPYLGLLLFGLFVFLIQGKGAEKGKIPWGFLFPFFFFFSIFHLYPLAYAFYLSLTNTHFLTQQVSFVGLQNYQEVWSDPLFQQSFKQTLFFTLGTVPCTILLGLLTALLLAQITRFRGLFRVAFFIPTVTGLIVVALIFSYLYENQGLLNLTLRSWNLSKGKNWLMEKEYALPAIMLMSIWSSFGYYAILFLAGLSTIPASLYEAAKLDGASPWSCFWYITLPQMKPFLGMAFLLNTIYSFQVFPEIFTMTQGGPEHSTSTLVYYIYQTGFQDFEMGKACAASFFLLLSILTLALLQKRIFSPPPSSSSSSSSS